MYHAIVFTGIDKHPSFYYRSLGAYRIRTEMENAGFRVKVIDYFHHLDESLITKAFEKYVTKDTLWVGFSTTFFECDTQLDQRAKFFDDLKNRFNVKLVVGGAKSLLGKFSFADYIVTGHADDSVLDLTRSLLDSKTEIKYKKFFDKTVIDSNADYDKKDLSNIPVLWKDEDYLKSNMTLPIEIARGCIFNCSFCNYPLNNKSKFDYIRLQDSIKAEFIRNYELFGITDYQFMDDTYNDSLVKLNLMEEVITSLPFKLRFDAYIKPEMLVRWPEQIDSLVRTGLRGASLGVESFNPLARKAIQKMPDIDKVLKAIESLKTKSLGQVKTQVNLIVGLPDESEQSLIDTQKTIRSSSFIDFWNWWPLQIHDKNNFEYHSPIDKNPQKYGYQVSIPIKSNFRNLVSTDTVYWKNDYMDVFLATKITDRLSKLDAPFKRMGGWMCGAASSVGVDIDSHFANKKGLVDNLPFDEMTATKSALIREYIKNTL